MKVRLSTPVASAALILVVAAAAKLAYAAEPPLQVIQPGDGVMSCAALAAEINALSAKTVKADERAASAQRFKGFGSAALRAATPMLDSVVSQTGGSTMAAASAARGAIQGVGGGYGYSQPQAPARTTPTQSLEQMRLQRLTGLHAAKPC